ncbi:tyrosine-type recombinase/integrase [Geodermatophilus sp. SYSU D00867]
MTRPALALGAWGRIALTGWVYGNGELVRMPPGRTKADRWRARARVRDLDGIVRFVERWGSTKAGAEQLLLTALRQRVTPPPADAVIKPTTKIKDAAEIWLAEVEAAGHHSTNTRKVYASSLSKHLIGGSLAHLTLREVKVVSIGRWLRGIGETSGPQAMKTARSVLSGILHLAVRHEAIAHNPVRDVGPVRVPAKQTKRDLQRAFTREERDALLAFADADPTAHRRDLGDLLAFMAGTGARVGEACGVRWSDLDLDAGTVKLGSLPVRVPGQGLVLQEEGKTKGSTRTLALPPWLAARLLARKVNAIPNEWDVVLCSPIGKLRDTSNTTKHVRALLDAAGFEWATGHTFRKTAATWLDEDGVTGRQVANQLGHAKPSMTMDRYMSRRTVTLRAAEIL